MRDVREWDLSVHDAIARLVDGETVHCFLNAGGIPLGADWTREQAVACLRKATEICEAGPQAQALGHGVAALEGGRWHYFATRKERP